MNKSKFLENLNPTQTEWYFNNKYMKAVLVSYLVIKRNMTQIEAIKLIEDPHELEATYIEVLNFFAGNNIFIDKLRTPAGTLTNFDNLDVAEFDISLLRRQPILIIKQWFLAHTVKNEEL